MPTLKYWDSSQSAYVAIPAVASVNPNNMVATIINTPTVASSPYTISHNLSTTNVMVQAWDTVTNDLIVVRMHVSDANHIQVFFEANCPNNVNVLVIGGAGSLAPAPVVAARMINTGTSQTFASGFTTVMIYDTVEYDTHGGCNMGTGTYTVPVGQPGDYLVTGLWATTGLAAGNYVGMQLQKNGAVYANGSQSNAFAGGVASNVSTVVRCVAGDTLRLVAGPGASTSNFSGPVYQYMTVHRIFPGLQAAGAFVPASTPPPTGINSYTDPAGDVWVSKNGSVWKKARDVVRAKLYRNAAWTLPNGGNVVTPFDTVLFDPLTCSVFGASAAFNCPIAGDYLCTGVSGTGAGAVSGDIFSCSILRNGGFAVYGTSVGAVPVGWGQGWTVTGVVRCGASDTLQLNTYCQIAKAGQTGSGLCFLDVSWMGPAL